MVDGNSLQLVNVKTVQIGLNCMTMDVDENLDRGNILASPNKVQRFGTNGDRRSRGHPANL